LNLFFQPRNLAARLSSKPGSSFGYNERMDFFFPEDDLNRMPPEETHITDLTAEPYPDGRRLRVNISITPFQTRPHIEVTLRDAGDQEVASVSVVEPMTWKLEITMHMRGELNNPYTLEARLYYLEGPSDQPFSVTFDVKQPTQGDAPI
jgi:hypothetical protein